MTDSKEKSQPVTVGVSLGWLDLIMLVQEEDLGLLKQGVKIESEQSTLRNKIS